MDLINHMQKDIQIGDAVTVCEYNYAVANNSRDFYIGFLKVNAIKESTIKNIIKEDGGDTWYFLKGSEYGYQKEWLTKRKWVYYGYN